MSLVYDIVIEKGLIVDGTGKESYQGSIGILESKIACIVKGEEKLEGKKYVNGTDKLITPGFIDIHTHVDFPGSIGVTEDPYAKNFIMQGVTSVIAGNCGSSTTEVAEFLNKIEETKVAPNVGTLVGHGALRSRVMEMSGSKPTENELEQMKSLLRKALEEGALGLSSGLGYTPGNYADIDELVELCKEVVPYGGYYTSHIRNQSAAIKESWEEIAETGRRAKLPVHVAHTQIIGREFWGQAKELVEFQIKVNKEGIRMTSDSYPRNNGTTPMKEALLPHWAVEGNKLKERLEDEETAKKIKEDIAKLLGFRGGSDNVFSLFNYGTDQSISKKTLTDIAKLWEMDVIDAIIRVAFEYPQLMTTYFQASFDDKADFYNSPYCAVGSDGWCEKSLRDLGLGTDPRSYGTMPDFFQTYVREKKMISLEDGIRRMTGLPVEIINVKDRGLLKEGMKADINVLDYESFSDLSTYEEPHRYPSGVEWVIINGQVVVAEGKHQEITPGEVIVNEVVANQ